jgi:hypothetical protein
MKEIAPSLGPDHRAAYHAMRAVLLALRAEKIIPALRAIFGGHKEPQQLPTWHGRRRPIIRPKADCS